MKILGQIIGIIFQIIFAAYWVASIIYTFKFWGIGWGLLSIFLPIFPVVDIINHYLDKYVVPLIG